MSNERGLDLGNLTHKQTTVLALGVWRALQGALAAHAAAVGADAAIKIRDRLVKDAKNLNTARISIDDEATSLTALVASIDFSFRPNSREVGPQRTAATRDRRPKRTTPPKRI
jgi:hypothetical protein